MLDGQLRGLADAAPEAREAEPVAECVCCDGGVEGAGAEEEESGEPAEEGGVGELEEGEGDGLDPWGAGVGEFEFVEVVDVRDAEVEGGDEDEGC